MSSRRTVLTGLGLMWLPGALPAFAQQRPRPIPRVGVLWHAGSEEEERVPLGAFLQGLRDIGYVEGQTILLENRFPNEIPERFVILARELTDLKIDVLVAITRPAALAAKQATTTIPIVFLAVPDPIGDNLVETRPGRQITGITNMALELVPKRIEVLKEAIPGLSRIGLLVNVNHPEGARRYIRVAQTAAVSLGVTAQPAEVQGPDDFDRAFSFIPRVRIARAKPDRRRPVLRQPKATHSTSARSPCAHDHVRARDGHQQCLMSYGPSNPALFRRGAYFVDKILRATKPADVPVEQPPVIELVINEKAAKSIGVSIAPSVVVRANDVLQ